VFWKRAEARGGPGRAVARQRLFGVGATDASIFASLPLLMLVAAALACLLPARRAAALDPARTLRED
jgi:putative ABC transport system permease protein